MSQKPRRRQAYYPEPPPHPTPCAYPSCKEEGQYRAPASRNRLKDYVWFCLEHVREYNQAWDYYAGMSEREIERHIREDVVGRRPTWPLGHAGPTPHPGGHKRQNGFYNADKKGREKASTFRFNAEFFPDDLAEALFGDTSKTDRSNHRASVNKGDRRLARESAALAILELKPPVTLKDVKERYKSLVKLLHPDINGGNRAAEEKLKAVNQAYSRLKAAILD